MNSWISVYTDSNDLSVYFIIFINENRSHCMHQKWIFGTIFAKNWLFHCKSLIFQSNCRRIKQKFLAMLYEINNAELLSIKIHLLTRTYTYSNGNNGHCWICVDIIIPCVHVCCRGADHLKNIFNCFQIWSNCCKRKCNCSKKFRN